MTTHSGESLLDWLRQQAPDTLSIRDIAHLVCQAADALQDMHNQGRIHRHVTPASFFIRPNKAHPGLPDLQLTGSEQSSPTEATGNPLYMAPEQWYGMLVPATDQYALAIIAYQLLTWHPPFQGTQEQLRDQHLHVMPQPPSVFSAHIPSAVDTMILRALSKKPEDRFPSIAAFASAFLQAAQVLGSIPARAQSAFVLSSSSDRTNINRLSASSQIKEMLVLGIVFLVVVSSIGVGFFSIVKNNQVAVTNISATAQVGVTSTVSPIVFPSTTISGIPIFEDNLSSNAAGRWDDDGSMCVFKGRTYHILVHMADTLQTCGLTTPLLFDNVAIEVDVSLLAGDDAGLILRYDRGKFYDFDITNKGEFFFLRRDGGAAVDHLIPITKTNAIAPGGQKNTLLVIAKGSDFKLFINGIFVGETQDSTYLSGQFGFVVGTFAPATSGDASFSNLRVFKV